MPLKACWFGLPARVSVAGAGRSCAMGISASPREDAAAILRTVMFDGRALPSEINAVEDVTPFDLDPDQVVANRGTQYPPIATASTAPADGP